jgi:hypothetical protein
LWPPPCWPQLQGGDLNLGDLALDLDDLALDLGDLAPDLNLDDFGLALKTTMMMAPGRKAVSHPWWEVAPGGKATSHPRQELIGNL